MGRACLHLCCETIGFNVGDNITRHEAFNEMMGFTRDETINLIQDTVKFSMEKSDMGALLEVFKKNYNGYMFSEDADIRLFNSDMILYYAKTYVEKRKGPNDLIDENIASDYGKLGKLFEIKDKKSNLAVLENILSEEKVMTQMTKQFNMELDFTPDDFKSLLFYMGLLTIDERVPDGVSLRVPNYVIKSLYHKNTKL